MTTKQRRPADHNAATHARYYNALLRRDSGYDGVVYFGIKTTGVFCRPVCPARKPKFENCEFFRSAQGALAAGYRPCKRCRPLDQPDEPPAIVKRLVEAVEAEPDKRWTDSEFSALGVDASTVRRQFKKRFGMTFVGYVRARRIGLAARRIGEGERVIAAQQRAGFDSGSGFRAAFARILGAPPNGFQGPVLRATWIDTPLGPMLAVAHGDAVCLLEFTDRRGLERSLERLRRRLSAAIVPDENAALESIRSDLRDYFSNGEHRFRTPLEMIGSAFQKSAWRALERIPPGQTRSYSEQAAAIGSPNAVRAVARANGANTLAIAVPCHRVIGADGRLTGYGGGLARKQWLLDHERAARPSQAT